MDARRLFLQRAIQVVCLMLVGVAVGFGFAQQQPPQPPTIAFPPPNPVASSMGSAEPTNTALNFGQPISRLMEIRKQKEELERQETAIKEQLMRQFRDLTSQLEKLGIGSESHGHPSPPTPGPATIPPPFSSY